MSATASRTSQLVALTRAELVRPWTPAGDAAAQAKLCAGMAPGSVGHLRASIVARTRFFDGLVLSAIAAGVAQVVVCGAGYDDRALRFRTPGVRFFEMDHPATQSDKARRLAALGAGGEVRLIGVDFRGGDVGAALGAGGHDAAQPTLYLCEGLLVYLDAATCTSLLAALARRASAGSVLAASLAVHHDGADTGEVLASLNARRRDGRTEPWRTVLPRASHLGLLAEAGWEPVSVSDAAELDPAAEAGRSLLVTASPAAASAAGDGRPAS